MNVASAASADDVRVRLCFFVKVRKACGRSVAGGRIMGRMDGLRAAGAGIGAVFRGRMGCAGVPKAGEDEGMSERPILI